MQRVGFKPGISCLPDWRPWRHSHRGFTFLVAIFDKLIQLLLHSKVAKAELYLIGGYHNEWLELTYYIETLRLSSRLEIDKNNEMELSSKPNKSLTKELNY